MTVNEDVERRVTRWISAYTAKELANIFGVAPRTAKGWLAGQLPQNKHLISMVERWGRGFIDDVFAPALSSEVSDDQRFERISNEIQAMRYRKKVLIALAFVVMSMAGASFGDDPIMRARTARVRRQTEDQA